LVFDDEADAATPDTTLAARSLGKSKAPAMASRIYRLVVANEDPNERHFSLGEELPHSLYVQVTATPYVLYLQRDATPIRPADTFLLEPGVGYCGGEAFFGGYDPAQGADPPGTLVMVDASEAGTIKTAAPRGLLNSVEFFLLSACARALAKRWPPEGFNHLSHTSARTDEHKLVAGYIRARLNELSEITRDIESAEGVFASAYAELLRTLPGVPALGQLLGLCRSALADAEVFRVNSKVGSPMYGPRLNFVVGGNILGRGLTIRDLLVTYYVREAKVSQMDTVWQHARMFGYRAEYLDYMRIFLPPQLATRFREIHDGEEALRRSIQNGDSTNTKLIRLPNSSRATRPNVLDPQAIRGIRAGRDQINPQRYVRDPKSAAEVGRRLASMGVVVDSSVPRDRRPTLVDAFKVIELIDMIPVAADDAGVWDRDMAKAMVFSYVKPNCDKIVIYVRGLEQSDSARTRGRLSGPEIRLLQASALGKPALALLHVGKFSALEAWFPTLVMPAGSPAFVFEGG
jgi:hypothetical protein